MKNRFLQLIAILSIAVLTSGCKYNQLQKQEDQRANLQILSNPLKGESSNFSIHSELYWGKAFNHPTFALWIEDMEGNYIETLFVTKSVASGVFGHAQASDSTWSSEPGKSYRPAALPVWFHKKGLLEDGSHVPTPEHPFVDAFVGATPTKDARLHTGIKKVPKGKFRVLLEINQTWDWNEYYHNNLHPRNKDYKSSAQPSLIYAVTIDMETPFNAFHLNPVGHGHYAGENGLLYTDLSKHTTALSIIDKAIVNILH